VKNSTATEAGIRVLIVDDNKIYREAFRRNLLLQNYEVIEAEDTDEAIRKIQSESPTVVITDLQMRTEMEGIDLIRQVKSTNPLLPIIMISAVGTFEEGALAQKFGASAVLSKSRIEDEIERLYAAINAARDETLRTSAQDVILQRARTALSKEDGNGHEIVEELRRLIAEPDTHPYVRSEAYNLFGKANERQYVNEAREQMESTAGVAPKTLQAVEDILRGEMASYDTFSDDSKESLRIAEFLYDQQSGTPGSIDFSRNIGFSYCFAVENEAKQRMTRRLQKFLAAEGTYSLIMEMMENNNQSLSIFYHQYLLLLMRNQEMDFTIDNVKQTFRRILEHQSRYKPDGLKALGIVILAFGRTYSFAKQTKQVKVNNPLSMKGIEADGDVIRFAELLVSLQHFRNPYIHPEISDMEKLSKIRATTFECLNMASRLQ
jgi:CheY-like chemotaxis protein